MKTQSALKLASWLLLNIPAAVAHTWVEEMSVIAPNGTFTGAPGYSRGYMSRTMPDFEDNMVYLLPPDGRANELLASDTICKSTQTIGNQTSGFPALVASPGDNIALRYQENGHVTLPNTQIGKPANRGTVYIYGTTQPNNDDKILDIHKVWNAAGTGGDGRGVLLATRNFDDGQCYQVNGGNISVARQTEFKHNDNNALMGVNLWCQTDVQLPSNVSSKSYSLYWVWDWPTAANVTGSGEPNGKIEIYTTCMDVQMQASTGAKSNAASHFAVGQELDYAAIQDQLTNQFQVPVAEAGSPSTAAASSAPAQSVSQSSTSVAVQPTAAANGATTTVTNTVTVTQTQAPVTVTVQAGGAAAVTSYITVTANKNAASSSTSQVAAASPITSSQSMIVTPFLQASTMTTIVTVSTTTLTITADAAPTNAAAAGTNSTVSSSKKLKRSPHLRRHLNTY